LIQAEPGDVFVFFSDGITDAVNAAGLQFGRGRLEEVVKKHCKGSAESIITALEKSVRAFAGATRPFDDETVVILKVKDEADSASQKRGQQKTNATLRNI